ncbi:fibronectin type III domain-containing protein [Actinokineospora sp. NBRC 105648]|uniref:fibronectin type III domain-containing protein n=1 Tax=Actinokineospora sp. NBRC 105648 TaxID=3032206 RepID=UPI0024A44DC4|nr:fibronectin type III domain-containing protein [Actinokineospora sp. NBRC 105648]GLZ40596.1 hypothetical protein Acsp05_42200 [Actinokineospora sp. NBRC 105648]
MDDRWRKRLAVGAWTAVFAVAAGVVTVAATGDKQPELDFQQPGHWVYGADGKAVYHVDGGTKKVDSRTGEIELGPDHTIVQSENQVLVAENGKVTEFGKSTLAVQDHVDVGINEVPVGLEVVGGPYLVYRQAGTIVRFGQGKPTIVSVKGPLGDPAVTDDGTVWVQRQDSAALCSIDRVATEAQCPATAPGNRRGTMAAIGTQALFVDAAAGTVSAVGSGGLGLTTSLGERVADARVASSTTGGRLAIVDQQAQRLVLADVSTVAGGATAARPVSVPLGDGDYATPVPTDGAVVVLDRKANRVLTFDSSGGRRSTTPLPEGLGKPRISRGEDGRVYVDGQSGKHTLVVDKDGSVASVLLGKPDLPAPSTRKPAPPSPQPAPPVKPPATTQPKPPPPAKATPPGPPTSISAQPGNALVTLSWAAADPHGAAVSAYQITWRVTDGDGSGGSSTVGGSQLSTAIPDLRNGTTYVFSIAAANAAGPGPSADSPPARPSSQVPGTPGKPTATAPSGGTVELTWRAASGEGRQVTAYTVTATGDDGSSVNAARASGTTATLDKDILVLGTTYTFTVTATNDANITGSPSEASNPVTPYQPASAPGGAQAAGGDRTVTLTWQPSELNGGELVGYRVTAPGVAAQTVTDTRAAFSGLTNGKQYDFAIAAQTRQKGQSGTPVTGEPAQAIGTPGRTPEVGVVAARQNGDRQIVVTVSVDDHSSGPVTCHISLDGLGERWTGGCGNGQEINLGGLDYSTTYTARASGSNSFGGGPQGGSTAQARTNDPPPPPRTVIVSKGPYKTTTVGSCKTAPPCALINVSMRNFAPNTNFTVECHDDNPDGGRSYYEYGVKTNGAGSNDSATCIYGFNGNVWAVVAGVESNHVHW